MDAAAPRYASTMDAAAPRYASAMDAAAPRHGVCRNTRDANGGDQSNGNDNSR
jgi:hypothetical protein